jgi:hypothetical protein
MKSRKSYRDQFEDMKRVDLYGANKDRAYDYCYVTGRFSIYMYKTVDRLEKDQSPDDYVRGTVKDQLNVSTIKGIPELAEEYDRISPRIIEAIEKIKTNFPDGWFTLRFK